LVSEIEEIKIEAELKSKIPQLGKETQRMAAQAQEEAHRLAAQAQEETRRIHEAEAKRTGMNSTGLL
jgi:hypothetical protein